MDRFAPAAQAVGLIIHVSQKGADGLVLRKSDGTLDQIKDEKIVYDKQTKHWGFTQPDWDEFYRVINGDGPCNKERVALRRFSYEQGQWVRKAVMGYTGRPPAVN
ncbi:MAG: hypothetical protein IIB42_04315 [Candidatus Marinimicrobia bacterium]|nr:hypothetical protein [Candidatus Neomarinimicrobiota bacterium]